MADITVIQVTREDRKRIERRKIHPKQPVHEVIRDLLDLAEQQERADEGARAPRRERRAS
jgi:hypothetical protein